MKYKLFGRTGLRVSEICLGAMTFGKEWGFGGDKEDSHEVFKAFVEGGGNFIDTANRYTEGTSELFLGEFMQGMRHDIVLATKYTFYDKKGDFTASGNSRKNMMRSVEESLKRLKTDFIDVFYLHAWDSTTPIEEVLRGLDDLVRSGKILYAAISDTPAWEVSRANAIAEIRGWSSFAGYQVEYSLLKRDVEREILPMSKALDLAVTAWGPIAGGVLSGKYLKQTTSEIRTKEETIRLGQLNLLPLEHLGNPEMRIKEGSIRLNPRSVEITKVVVQIANEIGCSAVQVALNWVRQQTGVVIPIVGARKKTQIEENLGCLNFPLSNEHIIRLNNISQIELGFPHDFLESNIVQELAFAGQKDKLINHRSK